MTSCWRQALSAAGRMSRGVWDVGELQGGFAIMAYGMRLTFAYVAQTQEFHGQTGGLHQFGSAQISIRF